MVGLRTSAGGLLSTSLPDGIVVQPFGTTGRARIAPHVNRPNLFNLTIRRCTEAEIAAAEQDDTVFTLPV